MAKIPQKVTFRVVGVSFCDGYPDNITKLEKEYRNADMLGDEMPAAVLIRAPQNKFDKNAIEVHVPSVGGMIGHIAAKQAEWFAETLDLAATRADFRYQSWVSNVAIHPDHPDRPGLNITCQLHQGAVNAL